MTTLLGAIELLGVVAILVLIVVSAVVGWERYRPGRSGPSPRAHPTDEVFIDPETGRRKRVWFDPTTGGREYRDD
jgi:hypothetical protein